MTLRSKRTVKTDNELSLIKDYDLLYRRYGGKILLVVPKEKEKERDSDSHE